MLSTFSVSASDNSNRFLKSSKGISKTEPFLSTHDMKQSDLHFFNVSYGRILIAVLFAPLMATRSPTSKKVSEILKRSLTVNTYVSIRNEKSGISEIILETGCSLNLYIVTSISKGETCSPLILAVIILFFSIGFSENGQSLYYTA